MNWTAQPPTAPGIYWLRSRIKDAAGAAGDELPALCNPAAPQLVQVIANGSFSAFGMGGWLPMREAASSFEWWAEPVLAPSSSPSPDEGIRMNAPDVVIPILPNTPYGGGLFAGRFVLGDTVYGLVVAAADGGELAALKWGTAKNVAGALSYNDGMANTQAMAAAGSALGKWAQGLRIGGFEDWYLPSRLEALILFGALGTAGDFSRDWYWTSTQYAGAGGCAWYQYFHDGGQCDRHEDYELRARAVRRFLIQ